MVVSYRYGCRPEAPKVETRPIKKDETMQNETAIPHELTFHVAQYLCPADVTVNGNSKSSKQIAM